MTAYSESVRLEPQHAESHCQLANALRDLGKLDKAITAIFVGVNCDVVEDLREGRNEGRVKFALQIELTRVSVLRRFVLVLSNEVTGSSDSTNGDVAKSQGRRNRQHNRWA